MKEKVLIIGASGQIGTELTLKLRKDLGEEQVVASDLKTPSYEIFEEGAFEFLDIMDKDKLHEIVKKHKITTVYLLAALLSATAEQHPVFAWNLNMEGLFNVMNLAKEGVIKKVFWPSSIAVFGPTTPKVNTPQYTIMEPNTVYGISKLAGERWCEYYHQKFGVDVRSIRYPGLISYKAQPGGGTTDYAVHIFHEALKRKSYKCFLEEQTTLPMMYMPDAIDATINLMSVESNKIKVRSAYNVGAFSFNPKEIAEEIKKHIPEFSIDYAPDSRQKIAETWPQSIDDSVANNDWGWKHKYDLSTMVDDMLKNLAIR